MARKSAKQEPTGLRDLLSFSVTELDKAINRPSVINYQPYKAQLNFHQCDLVGRYMSAGNRAGKCLVEGTEVQMADGSVKAIEDIRAGEYVIAPDGSPTRVTALWNQGMKEVNEWRIGRYQDIESVTATPDHKFWSVTDVGGRHVVAPRSRPIKDLLSNSAKIIRSQGTNLGGTRETRAYVLGLMLGDGYISERAPSNLQFTCADPSLASEFDVFVQRAPIQYSFTADTRDSYFEWFRELGLLGSRSGTKFIPEEVWGWDEESIGEVIAGLAVTDGSWWISTEGENHFSYTSKSRRLIEDFRRYAGLRLGIWGSTVNVGSKGTWQITYGTREALAKLAALPIKGVKKALAEAAIPKRASLSSFVGVKEFTSAGVRQCWDITVEHDSHCFMLANGIFTSNTTAAVVDAIWWATDTHPYLERPARWGKGAIRIRFVVVDIEKGAKDIILPELRRWVPTSQLVNGSFEDSWDNTRLTFTFVNGSTIQFLTHGMDLDKHGGVPLHLVFFDEIPPLSIFNENLMRLLDFKGRWVISATSVDGMGWTHELIWEKVETYLNRIQKPNQDLEPVKGKEISNVGIFQLSQKENPYLQTAVEERGDYYIGMDENERAIREEGEFQPRSGRVFPNWNQHTHVLEEPWIPPRTWRWYSSVDFGFNNPTAWLWHAVSPDGRIYTFAEHYQSEMTVQQHAEVVLAREAFWHVDPGEILRVGDPNNGTARVVNGISYVSEYANNGVYIGTEITRDVVIGIEKMQQYVRIEKENGWGKNRPRWLISPNCVNLIREMKKLRWASYESSKKTHDSNRHEEVHKKDDHAFDSARYLFALMPELQPSIDEVIEKKAAEGIQMSYAQTMAMLRADDRVEFVSDRQQKDLWDTELLPEWEEV